MTTPDEFVDAIEAKPLDSPAIGLREALERSDKLIDWMSAYIGRMAADADSLHQLNAHSLYMEALRRAEQSRNQS